MVIESQTVRRAAPAGGPWLGVARLLALALPTLAAFGGALPFVGPLFMFRAAALLFGIVALTFPPGPKSSLARTVHWVAAVWLVYGSALTLFASDRAAALPTMVSVFVGLVLAMACMRIIAHEKRLVQWLVNGWVLSFLITGAIGVWELVTGRHLPDYFVSTAESTLPAATFYNPNAFAVYLVCTQAVLLWKLRTAAGPVWRLALVALSFVCVALIVTTGSRLCIAAVVMLAIVFFALDRVGLGRAIFAAAIVMAIAWQFAPGIGDALASLIPSDVQGSSGASAIIELGQADSSAGIRVGLINTAGWIMMASGGLGVGPGNFGAAIQTMNPPYETFGTLSPHSFIGEVGAEFGAVILLPLLYLLWRVFHSLMPLSGPNRAVVISAGIAFIPAGFANSGYLASSAMWVFFSMLMCLTHSAVAAQAPDDVE